jgi:hypothetical protein
MRLYLSQAVEYLTLHHEVGPEWTERAEISAENLNCSTPGP